jgi:hypothetical protein
MSQTEGEPIDDGNTQGNANSTNALLKVQNHFFWA